MLDHVWLYVTLSTQLLVIVDFLFCTSTEQLLQLSQQEV